ncbi:MAG TPA: diphthine--ammonia ligase [Blastocatellia bacterium]|nr:diphthine--ammonia ligase [Blastocatellia bacterium]
MSEQIVVSWSGGKDSCMALYDVLAETEYKVAALITTLTRDDDRISIHGVRRELVEKQAESLGLEFQPVYISAGATNDEYESNMRAALAPYQQKGISRIVFGDLFLEDIKKYRDRFLASIMMEGIYPIWKRDTSTLARDFLDLGFQAVVSSVNSAVLDQSFAGRVMDEDFLSQLPATVDPCGENGEFHTFVFAGPIFKDEIKITAGETVTRSGHFCSDLLAG